MAFLASSALLSPFRSRNDFAHVNRTFSSKRGACPKRSRARVSMMAKFQQRDDPAKSLDEESTIDSVVPPINLPTLTSLSNIRPPLVVEDTTASDEQSDDQIRDEISRMGVSMSAEQEWTLLNFLKSVAAEMSVIDWPAASRVAKITVIILVSIVVVAAGIYVVDGFFYSMAQILFETNA